MRTLFEDLHYGIRLLRSSPGFALLAIFTLALGIGVNTAVFGWLDWLLLRPLPGVADVRRVVSLENTAPNIEYQSTSYRDFRDYRDQLKLVAGVVASMQVPFNVGEAARSQRVWGEAVSGNYFEVLGVKPVAGRFFVPAEQSDAPGTAPVVVIGERMWQSRFRRDPGALGKTLKVNRHELVIIGVAPAEFGGTVAGLAFDMWVPANMIPTLNLHNPDSLNQRNARSIKALARLKDGVSVEQASAEVAGVARQLSVAFPRTNQRIGAIMLPLEKSHQGAGVLLLDTLQILMAMALVVLLIVCANVANLLLARSSARQREFSIRLALGAGRARVIRQMLTETLLLAIAATLVGIPMALWMGQAMSYLLPTTSLPIRLQPVELNGHILTFAALVCAVSALFAGAVPAWRAMRPDVNAALKDGGRGGSVGAHAQRVRGLLVAAEVALALVALVGASLFLRSLRAAGAMDIGFDNRGVTVGQMYLETSGSSVDERKQLMRRLCTRLSADPAISAASYSNLIPLGLSNAGPWHALDIQGYVPAKGETVAVNRDLAAPGYFSLLKIPLLEGRDFTARDDAKAPLVMIVNQAFARRYLGGRSPIGATVRLFGTTQTIVGMVRDAKYLRIGEPQLPYFYMPFEQQYIPGYGISLYVRSERDPTYVAAAIRREASALGVDAGSIDLSTLAEYNSTALFAQRLAAGIMSAMGLLALLLAALGLYSVMAYAVSQRTQEIGIRMALGARPRDVLDLVVRQAMLLTAAGLGAGVLAALAVTRVVAGLLVKVSSNDPLSFIAAGLFLALVALLASYVPAYRATRTNPVEALRCQ